MKDYPVNRWNFKFNSSNTPNITSFKVFLANQLTASFFDQHKKIMLGDKIVSSDNGLMTYKIKIFEDVKLRGDPNFPCIDYENML